MVKSEKRDHFHLVYHFTVPLTAFCRLPFSQKNSTLNVWQGSEYAYDRIKWRVNMKRHLKFQMYMIIYDSTANDTLSIIY